MKKILQKLLHLLAIQLIVFYQLANIGLAFMSSVPAVRAEEGSSTVTEESGNSNSGSGSESNNNSSEEDSSSPSPSPSPEPSPSPTPEPSPTPTPTPSPEPSPTPTPSPSSSPEPSPSPSPTPTLDDNSSSESDDSLGSGSSGSGSTGSSGGSQESSSGSGSSGNNSSGPDSSGSSGGSSGSGPDNSGSSGSGNGNEPILEVPGGEVPAPESNSGSGSNGTNDSSGSGSSGGGNQQSGSSGPGNGEQPAEEPPAGEAPAEEPPVGEPPVNEAPSDNGGISNGGSGPLSDPLVGLIDLNNGFPLFYQDALGTAVVACLDGSDPNCVLPEAGEEPFDPGQPTVFTDNFPSEFFYWIAESDRISTPLGGRVSLRTALEGAFLNEDPAPGDQMVFGRIRLTGTGLEPNSIYTVTHPYGVDTYVTNDVGVVRRPVGTEDIGCEIGPCDFSLALNSRVFDGFLKMVSGAPAGYLGDGVTAGEVVGSPLGQNFFRIEGPGLPLGGLFTNMFTVAGKLFDGIIPPQPPADQLPPAPPAPEPIDIGDAAAGPIDPSNGFPLFYQDALGTAVVACLDGLDPICVLPGAGEEPNFDPNQPTVFPTQFPSEFFYWIAESDLINIPDTGGKFLFRMAVEGAFLNEDPAPGDQMVFGRLRATGTGLEPNSIYTVTHPYGVDTYETNDVGVIRRPVGTEDIGCEIGPCDFSLALASRVFQSFLRWDAGAPLGYLGDAVTPHTVIGSPLGNNFVRIEGPGLPLDGLFTNLFTVAGKLLSELVGPNPEPPVSDLPVGEPPAEDTPSDEELPADGTPVDEPPAGGQPVTEQPVTGEPPANNESPADETTSDSNSDNSTDTGESTTPTDTNNSTGDSSQTQTGGTQTNTSSSESSTTNNSSNTTSSSNNSSGGSTSSNNDGGSSNSSSNANNQTASGTEEKQTTTLADNSALVLGTQSSQDPQDQLAQNSNQPESNKTTIEEAQDQGTNSVATLLAIGTLAIAGGFLSLKSLLGLKILKF